MFLSKTPRKTDTQKNAPICILCLHLPPQHRDMVYVPWFIKCNHVLFDVNLMAAL